MLSISKDTSMCLRELILSNLLIELINLKIMYHDCECASDILVYVHVIFLKESIYLHKYFGFN